MTDDIDWKQRCRKVAEWMGEVSEYDKCDPPDRCHLDQPSATAWPDYTRDDAAAWRLLVHVLKTCGPADYFGTVMTGWCLWEDLGETVKMVGGLSHKSPKKALVLAVSKLIEKETT